jgi:hypothetical protein
MVLVGGVADDGDMLLNDTWHYASQTGWVEAEPASVLPPGAYYVALFDPIGGTILLVTEGQIWSYR